MKEEGVWGVAGYCTLPPPTPFIPGGGVLESLRPSALLSVCPILSDNISWII